MQIRAIKVSAVLLFPVLLSGCIAAAIPVLAGSVMAGKDRVGIGSKSDKSDEQDPQVTVEATEGSPVEPEGSPISDEAPPPEPEPEPEPEAISEPETAQTVLALAKPAETLDLAETPAALDEAPEQAPVVLERVDALSFNLAEVRAPDSAVPVPARVGRVDASEAKSAPTPESIQPARRLAMAVAPKAPEQPRDIGITKAVSSYRALSEIFAYVDAQAKRDPIMQPRLSAILAAPGSLTPDRSDCSIRPPAVIFDLDRTGAVFDPTVEIKAEPAMTQMLRSFRMQEIDVFWISARAAVDAGKIRNRLIESGLDPIGRDGLLLMRRADDRKQSRRRELSETHCVIAIAGDTKADFDELYDYLKDPSAAKPLDDLLGAGWFLTPLPLGNSPLPLLNQSNSEGQ